MATHARGKKGNYVHPRKDLALTCMMNAIREVLGLEPLVDKGSGNRKAKTIENRFAVHARLDCLHLWERPKPPRTHA